MSLTSRSKLKYMFQGLVDGIEKRDRIKKYFKLPKPMTLEDKYKTVNNFISATFVRHPFVRLVSAFKDKVIDHNYHGWRSISQTSGAKVKEDKILEVSSLFFLTRPSQSVPHSCSR